MKIVFITPWYGMFAGGLEAEFRCYAQALAQAGYEVEVLATCSQSPYHDWRHDYYTPGTTMQDGVYIHRFATNKSHKDRYLYAESQANHRPNKKTQYDFFTYGINSQDLVDFIAQYSRDTVLVCGPYFQSLSYSVLTTYPNRIYLRPALHQEVQASWHPVSDMLACAKGYLLATEAEKRLAIYLHGHRLGRKIIEAPVIGVPVTLMPPAQQVATACTHYSLPSHYFLYVGRKEVGKGVDRLVTWYQSYLDRCEQQHLNPTPLIFLGEGNTQLVPPHPHFIDLGFVPSDDKFAIIAGACALINLSENESFSLVLMEAWSQQTPVIVYSQCAVTREHCFYSGGGLVADTPIRFSQLLNHLMESQHRTALGAAGRRYLFSRYTQSRVLNHFLHLVSS